MWPEEDMRKKDITCGEMRRKRSLEICFYLEGELLYKNRRPNWHALRSVKIERTSMSRTTLMTEVQHSRTLALFENLHFYLLFLP